MTDISSLCHAIALAARGAKNNREEVGTLYLSIADARAMDEVSRRGSGYLTVSSTVEVGDKALVLGMPAEVADLPPGVAYIGRRIDVNTPSCPHCGHAIAAAGDSHGLHRG